MGDANPIRTLGDYSKPSDEGYKNTIELPEGNNVVPLRSDTIRLVQNGCSFHGLRFEDPNQHLKDFLKLVDSLDLDEDQTTSLEPISQATTLPSPSHPDISTPRRLTRGAIQISQSKASIPGVDETASPTRYDRHREAFPTTTSLDAG
ncbi:hypothetical protein Tco_0272009 [Tanacetum coccineum]